MRRLKILPKFIFKRSQPLEQIVWASNEKLLFFGIGNLSRQDDALGISYIEALEKDLSKKLRFENISFEANYQLNIEDAQLISEYDVVVFVDASKTASQNSSSSFSPFSVRPLQSSTELSFSSHAMSPSAVLCFCEQLYGNKPRTYLLALPGKSWELGEPMTPEAEESLNSALQATRNWLERRNA